MGVFYAAVVQAVLLYGPETWVMYLRTGSTLVGFHHRFYCRLMSRQTLRGVDRMWVYPLLEGAMAESGLHELDTYVDRLQNTVTQYIVTKPMDLCLEAEQWW